jgi:hypothetical protein
MILEIHSKACKLRDEVPIPKERNFPSVNVPDIRISRNLMMPNLESTKDVE